MSVLRPPTLLHVEDYPGLEPEPRARPSKLRPFLQDHFVV